MFIIKSRRYKVYERMARKDQRVVCIIIIFTVIPIAYNRALKTFLPDTDNFYKRHDHQDHTDTPGPRPDFPCHNMHQPGCEINTIPTVKMIDHCGVTVVLDRAMSLDPKIGWLLPAGLNCTYTVQAAAAYQRVAAIMYSLGTETGAGGNCTRNRLDIYDGAIVDSSTRLSNASGICGKTFPKENYLSSNDSLTVQFSTSPDGIQWGTFRIVIGTIETDPVDECYGEFQCKNGRCINKNDVCDGHDNCGDSSDEVGCLVKPVCQARLWTILFITACVVCFLLICIIMGIIGYRFCATRGYQRV